MVKRLLTLMLAVIMLFTSCAMRDQGSSLISGDDTHKADFTESETEPDTESESESNPTSESETQSESESESESESATDPESESESESESASESESETDENKPPRADEIDPDKPMVALTFDDGPSNSTPRILDLLDEYNAKATFCVVGERLDTYPETLKKINDRGHEIASHSWSHANLKKLDKDGIEEELESTSKKVKDITGVEIKWLRPPYGNTNDTVKEVAAEQGMAIAKWAVDTLDWKTKDPVQIMQEVKDATKDGDIILCHDLYSTTADAMEDVIPWLVNQGYQLVTLSELIYYKEGKIVDGQIYLYGGV